MDETRLDGFEAHVAFKTHHGIAESVVGEARMPPLAAAPSRKRVFVVLHGTFLAPTIGVRLDVSKQRVPTCHRLVVVNDHLRAGLALNLYFAPSCDVCAEVIDIFAVRRLEDGFRIEDFALATRHGVLRAYDAPRRVLFNLGRAFVDTRSLHPRVVLLAVAQRVEHNRRIVCRP